MSNEALLTAFPPRVTSPLSNDNSRYVVKLGKFTRPRLFIVGKQEFIFPLGTEGLRLYGNATLSEHRYIGWGFLSVKTMHRDSARIELSGVLPGKTGAQNMRNLKALLTAPDPPESKRLELPGILSQAQKVVMDNYDFSPIGDADVFGFSYQFTLVRIGLGDLVDLSAASGDPVSVVPDPRGQAAVFIVRQGAQTLKTISSVVYGDADKWRTLYEINKHELQAWLTKNHPSWSFDKIATALLPIGMTLNF